MKRVCWGILLAVCIGFSFASGPGDDIPTAETFSPDGKEGAEFHAWLVHREHVYEANLMQLRIRLFPNTNAFPGMEKADVNRFDDTVIEATIQLEGVSVPAWKTQIANRPQSHVIRERARGRAALEFCRRAILNASGLLVVAPRYTKHDRLVRCRLILIDEAGDRVNLAALLLKNGFASAKVVDWGRRMPE